MTLSRILVTLLIAIMSLPGIACAKRYRVDALVFLITEYTGNEQPVPAAAASVLQPAIDPSDTPNLHTTGIEMLPMARFGLEPEWNRLRSNQKFDPLIRLSWVQNGKASGTPLRIDAGPSFTLPDGGNLDTISGYIALFSGKFLHLDANISYTQNGPNDIPVSYRIKEVQRVKFNQLHYFDSPRLGMLVRVTEVK